MVKTTKKPAKKVTAKTKVATKKSEPKAKFGARRTAAKNSWYKQMWPKQWVMVSLALFLLLVLGYIGFNKYQISQEKKQFDAAEAGLDALYADIVKELGTPTTFDKDKSCSYASAKSERGRLGCSVALVMTYPAIDRDQVRDLAKQTHGILVRQLGFTVNDMVSENYSANNKYEAGNSFDVTGFSNRCGAYYSELKAGGVNNPGFEISLICGGNPKTEIYPVD